MQVRIPKFRDLSPVVEELSRLPPHAGGTNTGHQSSRLPLVQLEHENQVPEDTVPDAPATGVLDEDAGADDGHDADAAPEPADAAPISDTIAESKPDPNADADTEPNADADTEPDADADANANANAKRWGNGRVERPVGVRETIQSERKRVRMAEH